MDGSVYLCDRNINCIKALPKMLWIYSQKTMKSVLTRQERAAVWCSASYRYDSMKLDVLVLILSDTSLKAVSKLQYTISTLIQDHILISFNAMTF
jgi:hypothetical protein